MLEGWGRGRGLPGSPAPPCRRQHRASAPPKGQSHLIRPNLQAGARSEVTSHSSFHSNDHAHQPRHSDGDGSAEAIANKVIHLLCNTDTAHEYEAPQWRMTVQGPPARK